MAIVHLWSKMNNLEEFTMMNQKVSKANTITKSIIISVLIIIALNVSMPKAFCKKSTEDNANGSGLHKISSTTSKRAMFKLHHIGVVVRDLDEAVKIYCDILGLSPTDERIERFEGKENKTAMLPIGEEGDFNSFELMEPISESWLDNYIKKDRGEGFFHLAILIDNFDAKVKELKEKGFTIKEEEYSEPFPGCTLLREAYILPKDTCRGVLIDLIDAENFPESEGGLAPLKETEKE